MPHKKTTTSNTSSDKEKPKAVAATGSAAAENSAEFVPYEVKKNEEYMNKNQREHFAHILQQLKSHYMMEVDRTIHHLQDEANDTLSDLNDRASREEAFGLELRARNREGKLLKKIEEALDRVQNEDDDFGYCNVCGIEIGIRRLEARPTAELCIDCKTLDEIKERQTTT